MRIISKFHDYYDSVRALGHDTHVAYLRETVDYAVRERRDLAKDSVLRKAGLTEFALLCEEAVSSSFELVGRHEGARVRMAGACGLVCFVGKLHPFLRLSVTRVTEKTSHTGPDEFFYSAEALEKRAAEVGMLEQVQKRLDKRPKAWNWGALCERKTLREFFDAKTPTRLQELAYEHALPVAVFEETSFVGLLRKDPPLREYQFFRAVEPWQAHQELEMFLGNLAAPEAKMVTIADKDRIPQHGFDRWSFRRRPI